MADQDFKLLGASVIPASAPKGPLKRFKRWLQVRLANWLFGQEPMVWTKLGNMPESALEHKIEWGKSDTHIVCVRSCSYKGEEVKREPHIMLLASTSISAEQGTV